MDVQSYRPEYEKVITFFSEQLSRLRTGRATPALVEPIMVEAYGTKTPLSQLASITAPEPRQIVIDPWDKSIIKDIEKAVSGASVGASVKNEGEILRLHIAPLTEENRKKMTKTVHEHAEKARIALRSLRDKIKEEIITAQKDGEITEDDRFREIDALDALTREYTQRIDEIAKQKENEIMNE